MAQGARTCNSMFSCIPNTDDKSLTLETSEQDIILQNKMRSIRKDRDQSSQYSFNSRKLRDELSKDSMKSIDLESSHMLPINRRVTDHIYVRQED